MGYLVIDNRPGRRKLADTRGLRIRSWIPRQSLKRTVHLRGEDYSQETKESSHQTLELLLRKDLRAKVFSSLHPVRLRYSGLVTYCLGDFQIFEYLLGATMST